MNSKLLGIVAALSIVAAPASSFAANEQVSVAKIGDAACRAALFDSDYRDIGPNHYRRFIEAAGVDTDLFCGCVADEFVANEDLQAFRMDMTSSEDETEQVFREILVENLEACLPAFNSLPFEVQEAILAGDDGMLEDPIDGDLVDGEQDGYDWRANPHFANCVLVAEDIIEAPEFDRDGLDDWFEGSGLGADDLCGCVDVTMQDHAAAGTISADGNTGTPFYWETLQSSVSECRRAMWNGR